MFPFLIFVAAVAGFFGSSDLAHEAAKLVFAEWPEVVARPIADEVERVLTTPRSGGLLTFGAVFSFYFASSAIEALRVGLNRAYGLIEPRPWWMLRLQSLGLVLIGSIALLALAFLVVLGPLIVDTLAAFFPSVEQAHTLLTFLRIGIAGLMLASSLILAHIILPAHRVGFRDILPGVTLTFVASIAFGELFGVLFERISAQLHFDLRGPGVGDDRARLSLLGGAACSCSAASSTPRSSERARRGRRPDAKSEPVRQSGDRLGRNRNNFREKTTETARSRLSSEFP